MIAVKVREKGKKQWAFLTRNGTNRLRVHASQFASKEVAQKFVDANAPDNPEWEWKVVEV